MFEMLTWELPSQWQVFNPFTAKARSPHQPPNLVLIEFISKPQPQPHL